MSNNYFEVDSPQSTIEYKLDFSDSGNPKGTTGLNVLVDINDIEKAALNEMNQISTDIANVETKGLESYGDLTVNASVNTGVNSVEDMASSDYSGLQSAADGADKIPVFVQLLCFDEKDRAWTDAYNKEMYDAYLKEVEKWNNENPDNTIEPQEPPETYCPEDGQNPMDDNYIDPSIEKKYGSAIKDYLSDYQVNLIDLTKDLDPVSDPNGESYHGSEYDASVLNDILGSNGGTSTGIWGNNESGANENLEQLLLGFIDSNGGSSTGNDVPMI